MWQRRQQPHLPIETRRLSAGCGGQQRFEVPLHELRQIGAGGIGADGHAGVERDQQPDPRVGQCRELLAAAGLAAVPVLASDLGLEPVFLVVVQPCRVPRRVGQEPEVEDAEQHRWNALEHEEPLPSREAADALHRIHDRAGDGVAQDVGHGDCEHEPGDDPRPQGRGKPGGQVIDDARKEPRLGHAEEHAGPVVGRYIRHRGGEHRYEAPRDHDSRDPHPRPEPPQEQVARHLEDQVADEEESVAPVDHRIGETEFRGHAEPREADVGPVDDVEAVEQCQKRHEPPDHLPHRA